jgi:hypothetical protein
MKHSQPWHQTRLGNLACWLGSIQFAVPILALVAVALGWGTYIESTQDSRMARAAVYGSPWFMGVMGLVCVSLLFAVITRYPWKLRHVGFIVVHASLVTMIVAGFWSLFGRIEGHIGLEEGSSAGSIEMDRESLELVEHENGQFRTIGEADAPSHPTHLTLGSYPVEVEEVWNNFRETFEVTDDGEDLYRAVQIQFGPMAESAIWVGDEAKGPGSAAPVLDGIKVRVLAAGADWQPPAPSISASQPAPNRPGYAFIVGDKTIPLAVEGEPAFEGWRIISIKRYSHAMVGSGAGASLAEDPAAPENPAIEVLISDGKGTIEQHTAFEKFPDMILAKAVEGTMHSSARLAPPAAASPGPGAAQETLVVYGAPPGMNLGYIGSDGASKTMEHDASFPWSVDLGGRKLVILKQFTRAREQTNLVRAPGSKNNRPALVVKCGQTPAQPLGYKDMVPVAVGGRVLMLRFGPRQHQLPFDIKLDDFRKTDYPGTDMAMSYESDVTISPHDGGERKYTISMNNPLVQSGWKVYQSGFLGENTSVFSVMRDPGLILTYISSVTLCLGILITFYGRKLSWGHPGVPSPFSESNSSKEKPNVPAPVHADPVLAPDLNGSRAGAGTLDGQAGLDPDPGRRQGDAAGHVRA